VSEPQPWQLRSPGPLKAQTARRLPDPRGWKTIAWLVSFGAVAVALHLRFPAAREAQQDIGTFLFMAILCPWSLVRTWREWKADLPSALAWSAIWICAVICTCIGIFAPHHVIPWFLSPPVVAIVLLLLVAVGTKPQIPRTDPAARS
jgi:peptidoglycan/LPS O-acetylase OafA/YrhL